MILAGGRSRRFGSPKALATLSGARMIDRVIDAQRAVFEEVLVVTDDAGAVGRDDVTTTSDIFPGSGPLGGLHAGLSWGRERGVLGACCAPCDAPFADPRVFRALLAAVSGAAPDESTADDYQAVIPGRDDDAFEPLFGWFSCGIVPVIEDALRSGEYSIHGMIGRLSNVRVLASTELAVGVDPDLAFFNVNTLEDLELARSRHTGEGIGR